MMALSGFRLLEEGFRSIFTCNHVRASVVEGKSHCPDCGKGIVFRWQVIQCTGCGQRRPTRYRMRQVVPQHTCCLACGDTGCETLNLDSPAYYQLRHALLAFEEVGTVPHHYEVKTHLKEFVTYWTQSSGFHASPSLALKALPA